MRPSVEYPSPVTRNAEPSRTGLRTVISSSAGMPVLSVAMCVVDPRVSTADSCLTITPRRASRWTPVARVKATTAGSPSGMVATARDTAVSISSVQGCPRIRPRTPPTTTTAMSVSRRARRSISTACPSRRTRAVITDILRSAAGEDSARACWT
ncbi:hypothetical protein GCM10009696_11350 [Kocuria himachalensis]